LKQQYNFDNFPYKDNFRSLIFSRECGSFLQHVHLMMHNIREFNADWFHSNSTIRQKRTPFNFVGTVLSQLFGTLDQYDAEKFLQ